MEQLTKINNEIDTLNEQLNNLRGTETEVYTRIVGYYRSVRNWNKGKREEYNHRLLFETPGMDEESSIQEETDIRAEMEEEAVYDTGIPAVSGYQYFYRDTCPNCPPVKRYVSDLDIQGTDFNVDSTEGMEEAVKNSVLATPTVIFFNEEGAEVFRANSVERLREIGISETAAAVQV